ncbi:MAG: nitrate ABC transporter ATP-binding protein, partial [Gammaproteobacteria bacterium RIFCSPHIGHO2_12_FULL_37_34]
MSDPIIEVVAMQKYYKTGDKQDRLVLHHINFKMYEGEIVAILGKSGSGKSTLLRIISGLTEPSSGEVYYRGQLVTGPVRGISMVFQTFSLLPWLTVLQNVELGLEAQGLPRKERRDQALKVIELIGLDGFETALPKELSGGMRQRVGFARALVVKPDILMMDEPFSALDVLTADTLKNDLLDLWQSRRIGINAILLVTHSIEEAIAYADRIILFDTDPGTIRSDVKINLPFPRSDLDPRFRNQVDRIYTLMTTEPQETSIQEEIIDIGYRLPEVNIEEMTGLLEILDSPQHQGKMDLPVLAETLTHNLDELLPLTDLVQILHFAKVSEGDITISLEGKTFAEADILERKKIFSIHLTKYIPLARYIHNQLIRHPRHR